MSDLQFDKAEFAAPAAGRVCAACRRPINDSYYEAVGAVLCPTCAARFSGDTGGPAVFTRAGLFGAGAALAGTIAWFLIMKLAHMELGLVAIAVGYFVGTAVRRGSGGRGGWKYQALAMGLTYASICTSYVPFIVKDAVESAHEKQDAAHERAGDATAEPAPSAADDETAPASGADAPSAPAEARPKGGVGGFLAGLVLLFGLAFAAPFLGGASNIMGLVIIAIALYEAWKLNRRLKISGPFRVATAGVAPAAPPPPEPPPVGP